MRPRQDRSGARRSGRVARTGLAGLLAVSLALGAGCDEDVSPADEEVEVGDAAEEAEDAGAPDDGTPPPDLSRRRDLAARVDAARPRDAGSRPDATQLPDAATPCVEPDALPDQVFFRTPRQTFNRRWYVALQGGRIWVKPNTEAGQVAGPWQLLGSGLPSGSGLVRFPKPTEIVEISADGVHLHALSSAGVFYRGSDLTQDVRASFTWTDKWGWPLGEGDGMEAEFPTARGWSVSDSHPFGVDHYEDRLGTQHSVGLGVAHVYRLGADGRRLVWNDWFLPDDWSRQICLPERGTLLAENLSTSASTTMVIGARGEIHTRLYDFDTGGENDLLTYSYVITGPSGTTRALPAEPWRRQPDITDGRITRRITIFQDGKGNAARVLRVEGERQGRTGFYEKRVLDPAWTFRETGLPVCGPFLNDPSRPPPPTIATADQSLTGTLSLDQKSVAITLLDFNLFCSPARAQLAVGGALVTVGGAPLELAVHHVHAMVTDRRPADYWLAGTPAKVRGAIVFPSTIKQIDSPAARSLVTAIFANRKVVNFEGTALPGKLDVEEIYWTTPFRVPADEKALLSRVKLKAAH